MYSLVILGSQMSLVFSGRYSTSIEMFRKNDQNIQDKEMANNSKYIMKYAIPSLPSSGAMLMTSGRKYFQSLMYLGATLYPLVSVVVHALKGAQSKRSIWSLG